MSGKLNIHPSLTSEEWLKLEELANTKKYGKNLTHLLYSEINKKFPSTPIVFCCEEKFKKIKKHFDLDLGDNVTKSILCRSKALGVSPVELICRVIIFPLINPLETNDNLSI